MKKAMGICLALAMVGLLGLLLADKSVASPPPPPSPAPTNAAPAFISGIVLSGSGLTS